MKEIVIEGVKPKKDSVYILDALPVGSGINGVMKAKPFTEYEKKNEEQELEEAKKCILTDNDILTDEQENEFREKFVSEKVSELMDAVNNIAKVYIPKENSDLSKKMDIIGIEGYIGKYASPGCLPVNKVIIVAHAFTKTAIERAKDVGFCLKTINDLIP